MPTERAAPSISLWNRTLRYTGWTLQQFTLLFLTGFFSREVEKRRRITAASEKHLPLQPFYSHNDTNGIEATLTSLHSNTDLPSSFFPARQQDCVRYCLTYLITQPGNEEGEKTPQEVEKLDIFPMEVTR